MNEPLKGVGARLNGGRWNSIGTGMSYAASSLELAVLEALVQVGIDELGDDYHWLEFELPDTAIERLSALPAHWDTPPPYRRSIQDIGNEWIKSHRSLALSVPSAVLPERRNVLINPAHPRFPEIQKLDAAPFTWPKRLIAHLKTLRG